MLTHLIHIRWINYHFYKQRIQECFRIISKYQILINKLRFIAFELYYYTTFLFYLSY